MKCVVSKDSLKLATSVVSKLGCHPDSVTLRAKDGVLTVFSSAETYVRYNIPAEVEEEGVLTLQFSIFSELCNLRKKDVTLLYHEDDNTLNVSSGSKLGVYVLALDKDKMEIPKRDWVSTIKLSSKDVGNLRSVIDNLFFTYFIDEDQASLVNTDKEFIVKFADNSHCAFYTSSTKISDTPFEFNGVIGPIKTILNYLDSNATLYVDEAMLLFDSENITVSVPARQDKQSDFVKQSEIFLHDDNYAKGEITFDASEFLKVLGSISVVYEDGLSPINLNFKENKVILKLESSFGISQDKFSLESNTYGSYTTAVSLPLTKDALKACINVGNIVTMKISENDRFFRVSVSNDKCRIDCLSPFVK